MTQRIIFDVEGTVEIEMPDPLGLEDIAAKKAEVEAWLQAGPLTSFEVTVNLHSRSITEPFGWDYEEFTVRNESANG